MSTHRARSIVLRFNRRRCHHQQRRRHHRLRYRVVDLTTTPPAPAAGGSVVLSGGGSVTVGGTTLETPPTQRSPAHANSSLQAAVFLLRGEHGEASARPAATGIFADATVPSFFADFIEQLYNEEITGSCSAKPPRYCPNDPVSRAAMAAFLTRTFSLQ